MSRFPKHSKKCVFVEVVTLSVMSDYHLPFVDEETGSGGWWLVCLRLSWFYNRCATPQVTSGPDATGFCPDGIALVRISLRQLLHGRCFHPNHRPSSVVFLPPLTCCRPAVRGRAQGWHQTPARMSAVHVFSQASSEFRGPSPLFICFFSIRKLVQRKKRILLCGLFSET